ncbi:MAG: hypothetical protein M3N53_06425 [Actinomycetota bacterium]|nr:hypothetical protein [Actinomycetota bacterium]
MTLTTVPLWLRLWLALQVVFLLMDPLLAPKPGPTVQSLVWVMVMFVLGWGMWKHAKLPWVIAVALATLSVIGGLPVLWMWRQGLTQAFVWLGAGLVLGAAELAILLSRPTRDWVNEATDRKWDYAQSK